MEIATGAGTGLSEQQRMFHQKTKLKQEKLVRNNRPLCKHPNIVPHGSSASIDITEHWHNKHPGNQHLDAQRRVSAILFSTTSQVLRKA